MKSTHLRPIQGGQFPATTIADSSVVSTRKNTQKAQDLKMIWKQSKETVNRRYSFDDNGGGYSGL